MGTPHNPRLNEAVTAKHAATDESSHSKTMARGTSQSTLNDNKGHNLSSSVNTSTSKTSKFSESVLNRKKKSNATNNVRLAGVYRTGAGPAGAGPYQSSRVTGSGANTRKTKKFLTQSTSKT